MVQLFLRTVNYWFLCLVDVVEIIKCNNRQGKYLAG